VAQRIESITERARELLAPVAERAGCELLDLRLVQARGFTLRLTIDRPGGVRVEDCVRVSRAASACLDETPGLLQRRYVLEVSSPGLDRQLYHDEEYHRFAGRPVKLQLKEPVEGRRRVRGTLQGLDKGEVVVEVQGEARRFARSNIRQARLDPAIEIPGGEPQPCGRRRRSQTQRGRS